MILDIDGTQYVLMPRALVGRLQSAARNQGFDRLAVADLFNELVRWRTTPDAQAEDAIRKAVIVYESGKAGNSDDDMLQKARQMDKIAAINFIRSKKGFSLREAYAYWEVHCGK